MSHDVWILLGTTRYHHHTYAVIECVGLLLYVGVQYLQRWYTNKDSNPRSFGHCLGCEMMQLCQMVTSSVLESSESVLKSIAVVCALSSDQLASRYVS